MSPQHHFLRRAISISIRALAHALLLSGAVWSAHAAVEIEAKFIEINQGQLASQRDGIKDAPPPLPGLPISSAGKSGMMGVLSGAQARAAIETLQKRKGTDVLAAPVVTARSGQRASVSIGREFRYAAVSEAARDTGKKQPQKFLTKNTGVTLAVTPTLRQKGILNLHLEPEVVEFEGFVNYGTGDQAVQQPIFSTRKLNTFVSVHSGESVVLCMPPRKDTQIVEDRVPVLGRIPLLGRLFTSRKQATIHRGLYVLITARVTGAKTPGSSAGGARKHEAHLQLRL